MLQHEYDRLISQLSATPSLTQATALTRLRDAGASAIQAIKAVTQLFGVRLGEAKSLLAHHPAWQQVHRNAKPLHDAALQAMSLDQAEAGPQRGAR